MPEGTVRTKSDIADVVLCVYPGRDIVIGNLSTKGDGWACTSRRVWLKGEEGYQKWVLAGKSDAYLGATISELIRLRLTVTVEQGSDYQ